MLSITASSAEVPQNAARSPSDRAEMIVTAIDDFIGSVGSWVNDPYPFVP
jgi:hypothetical protein